MKFTSNDFFGKTNLNSFSYCFHLPRLDLITKTNISEKILKHGGVSII